LWSPDRIDDTDAVNLWTRLQDQEQEKACRQFDVPIEPYPAIIFEQNDWRNMRFAHTYEKMIETAAEFGADYAFIDVIWEHEEAYKETLDAILAETGHNERILSKFKLYGNMCLTLDCEVAEILGGEAGLKALCDRAQAKGVKVI
ncbi:MAG: hypothetical protein NT118_03680, partial [Lentisphaerae bacterium]|nr:hypothetical protein [Lentisphaerota bacterium]